MLPISDWTAATILRRAARRSDVRYVALTERSRIAIVLAIATTLNGAIAAATLLGLELSPTALILLLSTSFLLAGVPNLYWLALYYRNRLH